MRREEAIKHSSVLKFVWSECVERKIGSLVVRHRAPVVVFAPEVVEFEGLHFGHRLRKERNDCVRLQVCLIAVVPRANKP